MQNSAPADDKIYFLIDQPESAGQTNANALLARDVYRNIANSIDEALGVARQARQSPDPMHYRYHNTVLIDGDRGTGKSTVLVNLACYLKAFRPETLSQVHICAPVDPTLLEDHDDLFLNVILAAVLSDKSVEDAQQRDPLARQALAKQLQKLGAALEHMQSQREQTQKGMDKLRAFVGNQQLIQEVHDFFAAVLRLLDKKILILTIDDVDTGLDKAFENLEVVRRYLTSPYVMPVISGDLSLYHEVIWRKFHGRLLKDSKERMEHSIGLAVGLANEYERKVLPIQSRQEMPSVADYIASDKVWLCYQENGSIQELTKLSGFYNILDVLLNGAVNGVGGIRYKINISTVRALTQLIQVMHKEIFLPKNSGDLDVFGKLWRPLQDSSYSIYAVYRDVIFIGRGFVGGISKKLASYFCHEPAAVVEYMVFSCAQSWHADSRLITRSIFDNALFCPARQVGLNFQGFEGRLEVDWVNVATSRLSRSRIEQLPKSAFIYYPCPDAGVLLAKKSTCFFSDNDGSAGIINLANSIMLGCDSYGEDEIGFQVYVGRVFELVVSSLIKPISGSEIISLVENAPYHSYMHYVAVDLVIDEEQSIMDQSALGEAAERMAESINSWRISRGVEDFVLSPLVCFYAMKKFFSLCCVKKFSRNAVSKSATEVFNDFCMATKNVLAAFAFVEKGPFFGLTSNVSGQKIKSGFEVNKKMDFGKDVKPFILQRRPRASVGGVIKPGLMKNSVVSVLSTHPLMHMIDSFGMKEFIDQVMENQSVATQLPLPVPSPAGRSRVAVVFNGVRYIFRVPYWQDKDMDVSENELIWVLSNFPPESKGLIVSAHTIAETMSAMGKEFSLRTLSAYKLNLYGKSVFQLLCEAYQIAFGDRPEI